MDSIGLFKIRATFTYLGEGYMVESQLVPLEYDSNAPMREQYDWKLIAISLIEEAIEDLTEEQKMEIAEDSELEVLQDESCVISLN